MYHTTYLPAGVSNGKGATLTIFLLEGFSCRGTMCLCICVCVCVYAGMWAGLYIVAKGGGEEARSQSRSRGALGYLLGFELHT